MKKTVVMKVTDGHDNTRGPIPPEIIPIPALSENEILTLPLTWYKKKDGSGQPIRKLDAYGHRALVSFTSNGLWISLVDGSERTFPQDRLADAIAHAEVSLRSKLSMRLAAARKLAADLSGIPPRAAIS